MPPTQPTGRAVTSLRDLWLPVTVHVAWTLLKRGYTVTPALLHDARDHLLRSIDPTLTVDQVEWLTPAWVDNYLARRVDQKILPPPQVGPEVRIPAHLWRDQLLESADRSMQAVFRFHYAEDMALEKAAKHLRCSPRQLESGRTRLRAALRDILEADATFNTELRGPLLDTVLQRLATLAARNAPGPMGMMSPKGLAQAESCPRSSRAVRLIRRGHLDPRGLFPPNPAHHPARELISVVCLLIHPDARRSSQQLTATIEHEAISMGNGIWLLPAEAEVPLYQSLMDLCARGRPARHHVRAARTEGCGRWSGTTLLGPIANSAIDAARAIPWGDVCGRPALPLPAPPPPSATRWWGAALISAAASIALGIAVAQPGSGSSPTPIDAHFQHAQGGWDVSFDLPDRAVLDVVVIEDHHVRILHRSLGATRGAWATGYGEFRARIPGDQVALLASRRGIPDLERLVLDASQQPDPLDALAAMVHSTHPRTDFARSRSPVAAVDLAGTVATPL